MIIRDSFLSSRVTMCHKCTVCSIWVGAVLPLLILACLRVLPALTTACALDAWSEFYIVPRDS